MTTSATRPGPAPAEPPAVERPRGASTTRRAALGIALLAAGAAPVYWFTRGDSATGEDDLLFSEALTRYPSDSLADVVTVSDHVAVVTAIRQVEGSDPAPAARAAAGEGDIYRRITFRVDRTTWSRTGAAAPPATFEAVWWGWAVHEGKRARLVAAGAPWVELGGQYLMPLRTTKDGVEPPLPMATFPLDNTSAVRPGPRQESALARQLSGVCLADVTTRLRSTAVKAGIATA